MILMPVEERGRKRGESLPVRGRDIPQAFDEVEEFPRLIGDLMVPVDERRHEDIDQGGFGQGPHDTRRAFGCNRRGCTCFGPGISQNTQTATEYGAKFTSDFPSKLAKADAAAS